MRIMLGEDTKDKRREILEKDMEHSITKKEEDTQGLGKTTKCMEKEHYFMLITKQLMKEIGFKTISGVLGHYTMKILNL